MNNNIHSIMEQIRKNRSKVIGDIKPPTSLVQEIREWYEDQGVNRFPYYSMGFLVNTFGVSPSKIGPALFELGWTRRRSWRQDKPFCRVWVPPIEHTESQDWLVRNNN